MLTISLSQPIFLYSSFAPHSHIFFVADPLIHIFTLRSRSEAFSLLLQSHPLFFLTAPLCNQQTLNFISRAILWTCLYNRGLILIVHQISNYIILLQFLEMHYWPIPCQHTAHICWLLHLPCCYQRHSSPVSSSLWFSCTNERDCRGPELSCILVYVSKDVLRYNVFRTT